MAKQKMDEYKKCKLMYSLEFIIIAVAFTVIGVLKICGVWDYNEVRKAIFNWITIFGGLWMIIDFIWVLCSKKRRKKNSLLDKILQVPLGIYLIIFDLLCFLWKGQPDNFYQIGMPMSFFYIGVIYMFEGVYHWYHPVPAVVQMGIDIEKAKQEELEKEDANKKAQEEESKE